LIIDTDPKPILPKLELAVFALVLTKLFGLKTELEDGICILIIAGILYI
jgi:hypothetical protein